MFWSSCCPTRTTQNHGSVIMNGLEYPRSLWKLKLRVDLLCVSILAMWSLGIGFQGSWPASAKVGLLHRWGKSTVEVIIRLSAPTVWH